MQEEKRGGTIVDAQWGWGSERGASMNGAVLGLLANSSAQVRLGGLLNVVAIGPSPEVWFTARV